MAPERVYIGILFAITLHCACFQGTEGNNETKFISGGSRSGVSLDPSPQTYRIYLQKRTPLLLNCSFTVTDPSLIIKDYTWYLINSDPESEEAYDISNGQDKFFNSKVEQLQNGSLLFKSGYGGRKKGKQLEGDYECFVNTNRKEFLARRVNVTLAAMAKNFSIHPAPVSVALGGVARLSCSIKATPPTDYVWFKDKTQMLDGDRVTILSLGVLQIQDVTSSDVGSYACHTRSSLQDFRTKKSARAELTISTGMSSRPYFLARPQNITVAGGARAELECLVGGAPRPTVTWTKLGSDKKWRGNDPSLTGLSNLVFPSASYYEHNGQYKCSFTSQQGKQESTVFLTVVEPPVISKGLESLTLPVSKNQRFRVAFNLEPSSVGLNWAWMLQGWDIEDDGGEHKDLNFNLFTGGTELFIEHLQEKNTGFLQYIVQNDAGISISTAFLNVTKKPNAPDQTMNLTGIALDSKTIFLTWEHMHTLKKPETRPYVVKFHIVGTDNIYQTICANINMASPHQNCTLKASIDNTFLQPGTNYSISVTAYNVHGGGYSSDNVYVKTLEGVPDMLPQLTLTSSDLHSVLVQWIPLTPDHIQGRLSQYRLYYKLAYQPSESTVTLPPNTTSYSITGLKADTEYDIVVVAGTAVGVTPREDWEDAWMPYKTHANSPGAPTFTLQYVNMSAVGVVWSSASEVNTVATFDLQLVKVVSGRTVQQVSLPATGSYTLAGLEPTETYQVVTRKNTTGQPFSDTGQPFSQEFTLTDMARRLTVPDLTIQEVTAYSVTLNWRALSDMTVEYKVCYKEEFSLQPGSCITRKRPPVMIKALQPFTHYELSILVMGQGWRGHMTSLVVQTHEDVPSAPLNLTATVVGPGSVLLSWLPPSQPNGDISEYNLKYARQAPGVERWNELTQEAEDTEWQLDDLEPQTYVFKVSASNRAGEGTDSVPLKVIPTCSKDTCGGEPEITPPVTDVTTITAQAVTFSIEIIILIFVGCLVVLMTVLCLVVCCWRRCHTDEANDPNASRAPIFPGNGHAGSGQGHPQPGNGGHNGQTHVTMTEPQHPGHIELDDLDPEALPMLQQIPENQHSDSKGSGDPTGSGSLSLNGLRLNGLIKGHHGTALHPRATDLNSSNNSEELDSLMVSVMTPVMTPKDWADIDDSVLISQSNPHSEVMMPSDGSNGLMTSSIDNGELGELSSQDSGTGCGVPQGGWARGLTLDEIGGVYIDRATGDVLDPLRSRGRDPKDKPSDPHHPTTDRDSGHGSEAKSNGGDRPTPGETAKNTTPEGDPSGGYHNQRHDHRVLPPPPPPPYSSSSPSSNHHNHNSRLPQTEHSRHRGRHPPIAIDDLPPPPPPPPGVLGASPTSSVAQLKNSSSSSEGRNVSRVDGLGSTGPTLPEGLSDVAFSPHRPSPHLPHIA